MRDRDVHFMKQCDLEAELSTCNRKHVGAIAVRDGRRLISGRNGSLPRQPHCVDCGCDMENGHCQRAVHSEANLVANAARFGISLDGAIAFVNVRPCFKCFQLLVAAGIKEIIYRDEYGSDDRIENSLSMMPDFVFRQLKVE